ncbi:hypothetical protein NGB36_17265 [Streptomyces sp. RB6PN25]|uniref:Major facilitator superfamily (MFS) profile domain-containing protein n=1 Tax=Streptomyces humicola TaxID=2953240 RepID=A0ABT1PX96_9ACTN|nr:MFS transporter [Streptomyces humicola]MCQ4082306.1 hypothetical protein [Streptomyces humicola]
MDPRRVIAVGLVLLGLGMGLTGAAHGAVLIGLTVVLWTFAEITYASIANAYPGEFSPPHLRGRYRGADGIAHTLAGALGPAVGGFLYSFSAPVHWLTCAAAAVLGALLILGAKPGRQHTVLAGMPASTGAAEPVSELGS